MKKEMLINVLQPEECRIAIVEDGLLEELYVERASQESYVGNIYKGRIVNIEPSIQAAFVDFGIGRNGFLHVSDVDPVYYRHLLSKEALAELEAEEAGEGHGVRSRGPSRDRERETRRGGRDRRGPRMAEAEVVESAQPEFISEPKPIEEENLGGFGAGLDLEDEGPAPPSSSRIEPVAERLLPPPVQSAPPPVVPRARPVERAPAEDDSDFGAGLDLEPPAVPTEVQSNDDQPDVVELVAESGADSNVQTEVDAERPAKAKPRGRGRPRKSDEPAEPEDTGEAKDAEEKPRKPRRGRKKADADSETDENGSDEKPRPMSGAERRTTGDDEPEIQPFFGGDGGDFDVEAPNDRFASTSEPTESSEENGFATGVDAEETEEPNESEPGELEEDRPSLSGPDDEGEDFAPAQVGRGFNDDEEGQYQGAARGDRDRDRDRRGGRGRDRDRDGDRGRSRGRGRRTGPSSGRPPARDRGYPRPPIQEIFKRGQEVIVQVIKEGIGTKGPTLSTFISIAGRYLVLMPSLNRVGVSRKIEDIDARKRLREIMNGLKPPPGVGFIVRTAAIDRNEAELRNDLAYLLRLWQVVVRRIKKVAAPVEIYRESDMITRTIRDIFTNDIDTIWVDEPNAFAHASEFLQIVMPRYADRIRFHSGTEPLFNRYRVEEEIAKINNKRIDLPQGGSIIIEQTEALVAIDVNSGTFRADNNAEETAYRMNLLAAREIARQLRLRDLGGVIVNDFIDMRDEKHRRNVENALRDALERDRARNKILRISQFGLIEMTRQRIQPSLKKRIYNDCPHCRGTGHVKTQETMGIEVMRLLQLAAHRSPAVTQVILTVHAEAAFYLLNRKRREIAQLEEQAKMEVQINGQHGVSPDALECRCFDSNGNEVRLFGGPPQRAFRGGPPPRALPERRD